MFFHGIILITECYSEGYLSSRNKGSIQRTVLVRHQIRKKNAGMLQEMFYSNEDNLMTYAVSELSPKHRALRNRASHIPRQICGTMRRAILPSKNLHPAGHLFARYTVCATDPLTLTLCDSYGPVRIVLYSFIYSVICRAISNWERAECQHKCGLIRRAQSQRHTAPCF